MLDGVCDKTKWLQYEVYVKSLQKFQDFSLRYQSTIYGTKCKNDQLLCKLKHYTPWIRIYVFQCLFVPIRDLYQIINHDIIVHSIPIL